MGQNVLKPRLYENDFYGWTREQARLLRSRSLQHIDFENLAEEIETLGRSEASALRSSLRLIAVHLLKMLYQPEKATNSWRGTVVRERINVERLLKDNPGLKPKLQAFFREAYADARRIAAAETGLAIDRFPAEPVLGLEQARSDDYMPGQGQSSEVRGSSRVTVRVEPDVAPNQGTGETSDAEG